MEKSELQAGARGSTSRRCAPSSRPAHRSAGRELRPRLSRHQGGRADLLDFRRHRHRLVLRARVPAVARSIPARCSAAAWACGSRYSTRRDSQSKASRGNWSARRRFPPCRSAFWNDPDGRKYHAAYFERFPNVWHHGDHALHHRTRWPRDLGRSDAMLKPGGVRIGTASCTRRSPACAEIARITRGGLSDFKDDVRIVLFVLLAPGAALDDALEQPHPRSHPQRDDAAPRAGADHRGAGSAAHALGQGLRACRAQRHRRTSPCSNLRALANPDALEHFRDRAELRS